MDVDVDVVVPVRDRAGVGRPAPRRVPGVPAFRPVERDDRFERLAGESEQARLRRTHEDIWTDTSDAGGAKVVEICDVGPLGAGPLPELRRVDDRPELIARAPERRHGPTDLILLSRLPVVERVHPVPRRYEDPWHFMMLSPGAGSSAERWAARQ